jgi:hypothetical protein
MDYGLTLLAGVLGSLHCVGMCGAIVVAYSTARGLDAPRPSVLSTIPSHLVYNGGRVLSYGLIGAAAGAIGGLVGSVRWLGVWVAPAAGIAMTAAGLVMLGAIPRLNPSAWAENTWIRRLHLHSVANLLRLESLESKFYVGLLTPFLPCGLLYAMLLRAAAGGSAVEGALTMLLFGAGIVPALFVTGMVSSYAGLKLRFLANRLAAVTIIIMGVTLILRGAGIPLPFIGGGHEGH